MRPLTLVLAALAGPVFAQTSEPSAPGELLSEEELRAEIFGVHLYGYEEFAGFLWDECIKPNGDTVYRTYQSEANTAYSELGGLEIVGGQACFSYPPGEDPTPSCFDVMRTEDGYAFMSAGSNFVTTDVQTGINFCPEPGSLTS